MSLHVFAAFRNYASWKLPLPRDVLRDLSSRSANPVEDSEAAGKNIEQIFAIGSGLPIFAHRDVGHVLPQLHLQLGTDPPLLVEAGGVEPCRTRASMRGLVGQPAKAASPSARIQGLP